MCSRSHRSHLSVRTSVMSPRIPWLYRDRSIPAKIVEPTDGEECLNFARESSHCMLRRRLMSSTPDLEFVRGPPRRACRVVRCRTSLVLPRRVLGCVLEVLNQGLTGSEGQDEI